MNKYVVISEIDYEELGEFDSRKEATDFIKGLKEFDDEEKNPFNESYIIERRKVN